MPERLHDPAEDADELLDQLHELDKWDVGDWEFSAEAWDETTVTVTLSHTHPEAAEFDASLVDDEIYE